MVKMGLSYVKDLTMKIVNWKFSVFQIYLFFDSAIPWLRLCHSEIFIKPHKDILAKLLFLMIYMY